MNPLRGIGLKVASVAVFTLMAVCIKASAEQVPPGQSVFSKVKMDLRRLLHGGQEYRFHGPPPRAGTKLTVQTRVEDIYEKEGKRGGTMTFVVTVTEFRDENGTLVAEARSTAIETGKPASEGGK